LINKSKFNIDQNEYIYSASIPDDDNFVESISLNKILEEREANNEKNIDTDNISKDNSIMLSQNSIIEIINGGINLPKGLDQEFYIVKLDDENK
jgi:hypothetical protein